MKKTILFAIISGLCVLSCAKKIDDNSNPKPLRLEKAASYADQTIFTPRNGITVGQFTLTTGNADNQYL